MCPKNGMAASVWGFNVCTDVYVHDCAQGLYRHCKRNYSRRLGEKSLATPGTQSQTSVILAQVWLFSQTLYQLSYSWSLKLRIHGHTCHHLHTDTADCHQVPLALCVLDWPWTLQHCKEHCWLCSHCVGKFLRSLHLCPWELAAVSADSPQLLWLGQSWSVLAVVSWLFCADGQRRWTINFRGEKWNRQ